MPADNTTEPTANISEPTRKKAKTANDASSLTNIITICNMLTTNEETNICDAQRLNIKERTDDIYKKFSNLYEEFPEMKYIIDKEGLYMKIETSVEKHKVDVMNEKNSPLYTLPDEILHRCLSYVGKGNFGLVAPVSKKIYNAYKEEIVSEETTYDAGAASVETARYCFEKLCKNLIQEDELLRVAAVNGNIEVLRYAISSGRDLFPLFCSEEKISKSFPLVGKATVLLVRSQRMGICTSCNTSKKNFTSLSVSMVSAYLQLKTVKLRF